jgi:hypothetical protein
MGVSVALFLGRECDFLLEVFPICGDEAPPVGFLRLRPQPIIGEDASLKMRSLETCPALSWFSLFESIENSRTIRYGISELAIC